MEENDAPVPPMQPVSPAQPAQPIIASASASEAPKKASSKKLLILAISSVVLCIASAALFIATMVSKGTPQSSPDSNTDSSEQGEGATTGAGTEATPAVDPDSTVRKLISELEIAVEKACDRGFVKIYDDVFPFAKVDGLNVFLPLEKSYGLTLGYSEISSDAVTKVVKNIADELKKVGFERYKIVERDSSGVYTFINRKSDIVCEISGVIYLGCGHLSWLPKDKFNLANDLADAFYNKEGQYPETMSVSSAEIKDSTVTPYQTVHVGFDDAGQSFYRTSPNAKWQYFTGTQDLIPCNEYNTQELKNAFAGDTCYDEATGKESTVRP